MNDNAFWGRRDRGTVDNDPKDDVYDTCYPPDIQNFKTENPIATAMKARRREKLTLDALTDLTTHLNGIREERKAVLVVTEGWFQTVPLSDSLRAAVPQARSPMGEPVLWRRGPTTGVRFVATADPRFSRTERVRLELPTRSMGMASARLLDRQGGSLAVPLSVSDRIDASDSVRWIVVEGTLAPLAPGDYAIEVTLDGTTRVTAIRIKP